MDIYDSFCRGASVLAAAHCKYTEIHKGHGIDPYDWKILTQQEYWSPEQAREMRSVLANVLEVSMTIAGMPAIPMPGQYLAALIAHVVSPANRLLACTKAPDTFDAVAASGLMATHQVKPMSVQQLMGLVITYSGGSRNEPPNQVLPDEVKELMKEHSKK